MAGHRVRAGARTERGGGGRGAAARAQCAGARLDAGGGAGGRPRGGAGAPGREARERSAGPRRSPADRLRDRAGPGRHGPHGDGRDRRFARLPLAGAGAGAADRPAERHLLARLCPGVRGDRRAAVRQRPGGGDALPYGPRPGGAGPAAARAAAGRGGVPVEGAGGAADRRGHPAGLRRGRVGGQLAARPGDPSDRRALRTDAGPPRHRGDQSGRRVHGADRCREPGHNSPPGAPRAAALPRVRHRRRGPRRRGRDHRLAGRVRGREGPGRGRQGGRGDGGRPAGASTSGCRPISAAPRRPPARARSGRRSWRSSSTTPARTHRSPCA